MIPTPPVYTDFSQLAQLKHADKGKANENLEQVARQFESVFTHMVIKSMRDASLGNDLFNSNAHDSYRDMFDRQISLALSQGKGLGIADAMLRQLKPPQAIEQAGGGKTVVADEPAVKPVGSPYTRSPSQPAEAAAVNQTRQQAALKAYGAVQAPPVEYAMNHPLQPHGLNPDAVAAPNPSPSEVLRLDAVEKHARPGSPEAFIARVWPAARRVADELGVSPRVLVAQSALETGWGRALPKHSDGNSSHNYFGIKTHNQWDGQAVAANTTEIIGGQQVRERASFRAYDSIEASFRDFAQFLKTNPRYEEALTVTHDADKFVDALQKAGYATDPKYADKIKSIMNGRRMNLMIASADEITQGNRANA